MTRSEFWARTILTALATPAFYYGSAALGDPVNWVIAAALAVLLVWFGWLVIGWAVDQ